MEPDALYQRLLECWNNRDAAGYADLFTGDGSLVGFDGSCIETRAKIAEHLESIFDDHTPAAYVGKIREVRRLAPSVAILRGVAGMVAPGDATLREELNTIHLVVAVEHGGAWRAAHFQSTPAAFHERADERAALTAELEGERRVGSGQASRPR
jgi:uncharacterized protein (TIGR02246 family)